MTEARRFSLAHRLQSFRFAGRGLVTMLASQHNAWIHACATVVVLGTALWLDLSRGDGALLLLACVAVWVAEALNTALEFLCDVATPEFHPLAEKAKDVAAGAVLIAALGSVGVGLLVLGPAVWNAWHG